MEVLGRTNRVFAPVWLRLEVPENLAEIEPLIAAARESGLPLDISTRPILWGGNLRGWEGVTMARGTTDYERSTEHTHAMDLIQSHLIETLSCLGRETIDFYVLPLRRAVEEFQISGALEALESARQDGHIRHLAFVSEGPALASLGLWQFHDAFEAAFIHQSDEEAMSSLPPLARSRRVGVVEIGSNQAQDGGVQLLPVREASAIHNLLS